MPNIVTPKHIKQKLTEVKGEINSKTVVGDINTLLSTMGRSFRKIINKETVDLNNTIDQKDLTDIKRTFYPKTAEYTFSIAHGTFSTIYHVRSQNKS